MKKRFDSEVAKTFMEGMEQRPTFKSLRAALNLKGYGGSTKNISDAVKVWNERHDRAAALAKSDLPGAGTDDPPNDEDRMAEAKRVLWEVVIGQAASVLKEEIARMIQRAQDTAEKMANIEERLRVLDADNGRLWERVMSSRRHRSAEFWDRVMTVVADILGHHPNLTIHDIMAMIPEKLVEEGNAIDERMDEATFTASMMRRADGSSAGK